MNIVYTLNDTFAPQVSASMASVCENNKNSDNISFYLLSMGVSPEHKKMFSDLAEEYGRAAECFELNKLSKYFDFSFDTNGWNPIVLSRLIIDKILPIEVNRVLYLDGDTVIRGDLTNLWKVNLQDKTLGMCPEPTVNAERKYSLGLDGYYFNAGVILIDLARWRQIHAGEIIIDYYRINKGNLFANDQDAINGSMKNEIIPLPPTYNFYNAFIQYPYSLLKELMDPPFCSQKEFISAVNNPMIVHYLGEERPWRKGNFHKYRHDYKHYLSLTNFKDEPDEGGWHLYFACFYLFNLATNHFPKTRYRIVDYLIPKFMTYRKRKLNG